MAICSFLLNSLAVTHMKTEVLSHGFCILWEMSEWLILQFKTQQEINLQSRSRSIHMDKDDTASKKEKHISE